MQKILRELEAVKKRWYEAGGRLAKRNPSLVISFGANDQPYPDAFKIDRPLNKVRDE
jgi:hypothetical protein